jgi:DNA polymerase delta subunit 2
MTSAYTRPATIAVDVAQPFVIDAKDRSYKHQYSNIYFTRLHSLKPAVMTAADGKWGDSPG